MDKNKIRRKALLEKRLLMLSETLPEFSTSLQLLRNSEPVLLPFGIQFHFSQPTQEKTPNHFLHEKYVFHVCLQGSRKLSVAGKMYVLKKNEALLIPPYVVHTSTFPADMDSSGRILSCSFSLPEGKSSLILACHEVFSLTVFELKRLEECVSLFKKWYAGGLPVAYVSYDFGKLLTHFQERFRREFPAALNYESRNFDLLKAICIFIENNLQSRLTVNSISLKFKISPSLLKLIFCKEMNMPVGRYVTISRMRKVTAALRSSDMTISEIAFAYGFGSESALIRAYKRETHGLTPMAYRRRCRTSSFS